MLSTLDLIINFIESFLTILFVQLCMKSTNKYRYVYMAIATVSIFLLVTFYNINEMVGINEVSLTIFCVLICFIYAYLVDERRYMLNCMAVSLFANAFLFLSTTFSAIVYDFYPNFALFLILSKVTYFIITLVVPRKISSSLLSKNVSSWYSNMTMFLIIILYTIISASLWTQPEQRFLFYIILFILALLISFTYLMFKKSAMDQADNFKLLLINNEYIAKEKNYLQFEESAKEISKLKHDMKHILLSIKEYVITNDTNSIMEKVDSYLSLINNTSQTVNSGNLSLDYIISQNILSFKNKNIDFICNYFSMMPPIDKTDFYIIVGNLLENAIENCGGSNKKVIITVGIKQNNYYLKIVNTIPKSILDTNPNLYTSKKDPKKHGIGIESIKLLVNKYNGVLDFYEEGLYFYSIILLPINK